MLDKRRKMTNLSRTLNGIWWILTTGAQWRALPEEYGKWNSVYRCFNRWCKKGCWTYWLESLVLEFEEELPMRMIDASHIKAHQDSTKHPSSAESQHLGKTKGGQHEVTVAKGMLENIEDCLVLADKGYDCDDLRAYIKGEGGIPMIPNKKNRKKPHFYLKEFGKPRHHVENFFCRIKRFRRVNTRYDQLAVTFMGFVTLASIVDWLRI